MRASGEAYGDGNIAAIALAAAQRRARRRLLAGGGMSRDAQYGRAAGHAFNPHTLSAWGFHYWDADEDDRLRVMVAEGLSAGDIGLRFGRSKNAVIGRIRRLGLQLARSTGPLPPKPKRPASPKSPPRPRTNPAASPTRTPQQLPPAAGGSWRAPPAAFPVRTCQWIEGPGKPWTMCGCPTIKGGAWCEKHRRIVYVRRPVLSERLDMAA